MRPIVCLGTGLASSIGRQRVGISAEWVVFHVAAVRGCCQNFVWHSIAALSCVCANLMKLYVLQVVGCGMRRRRYVQLYKNKLWQDESALADGVPSAGGGASGCGCAWSPVAVLGEASACDPLLRFCFARL